MIRPRAGGLAERTQLDLFLDGREALLVDQIVGRIVDQDPGGALDALAGLRAENPEHPDLRRFDRLCRALKAGPPPLVSPGQLAALIDRLAVLVPTAERLLGSGAPDFLGPWWRALAQAGAESPVTDLEALPRYWIGLARHHSGDEREAVRLWLTLCWLAPESFVRWAPTLPSVAVSEAWATFYAEPRSDESLEGSAWSVDWFPAWLVLRHRWVAHLFHGDEVPDNETPLRVLRLLPTLLVLESQGYGAELVHHRRLLREMSPTFFRAYWLAVVEPRA